MFPGHVMSRYYGDVHWPPRSPDFSICDLFLWGHLKSRVYTKKPRTIDDLKNSIRQAVEAVPSEMSERAVHNFQEMNLQERRHVQDIILRTQLKYIYFKTALQNLSLNARVCYFYQTVSQSINCEKHEFPLLHPVLVRS